MYHAYIFHVKSLKTMTRLNRSAHSLITTVPTLMVLLVAALTWVGCSSSSRTPSNGESGSEITVEGIVNSFGAEPFAAVILNSEERNSWVLLLTPEDRSRLMMPARVRITGRVFAADWQGHTRAHMRVRELTLLDE